MNITSIKKGSFFILIIIGIFYVSYSTSVPKESEVSGNILKTSDFAGDALEEIQEQLVNVFSDAGFIDFINSFSSVSIKTNIQKPIRVPTRNQGRANPFSSTSAQGQSLFISPSNLIKGQGEREEEIQVERQTETSSKIDQDFLPKNPASQKTSEENDADLGTITL